MDLRDAILDVACRGIELSRKGKLCVRDHIIKNGECRRLHKLRSIHRKQLFRILMNPLKPYLNFVDSGVNVCGKLFLCSTCAWRLHKPAQVNTDMVEQSRRFLMLGIKFE